MAISRRSVLRGAAVGAAAAAAAAGGMALMPGALTADPAAPNPGPGGTRGDEGVRGGSPRRARPHPPRDELTPEVLVAGAGVGGVAAALALLRAGRTVVLTEPTGWVGGQLTGQGVPPDEHDWVEERLGATDAYCDLRRAVRDQVALTYPLTREARLDRRLDPGNGWAKLSAEPAIWHTVLRAALAPYEATERLRLVTRATPVGATTSKGSVESVTFQVPDGQLVVRPTYVVDATELGDLLPLSGAPYVVGREKGGSRIAGGTGERHNGWTYADPTCQQAFCVVAAVGYGHGRVHPGVPVTTTAYDDFEKVYRRFGENGRNVFDPTRDWSWNDGINFWQYRRVRYRGNLTDPRLGEITMLNQPENDHLGKPLVPRGGPTDPAAFDAAVARGSAQTLGLVQYLQRYYPRPDGRGTGWPGLFLVPNALGDESGLAVHPYVRESRRARAEQTVYEWHVGVDDRRAHAKGADTAYQFTDSVGIGAGPIDIHPTRAYSRGILLATYPFQIPFRSLVPQGMTNLLAGAKSIGTTHLTNGCYRYHPVEWSVGEAAGHALAFVLRREVPLRSLLESYPEWVRFAGYLDGQGVRRSWPTEMRTAQVDSFHA